MNAYEAARSRKIAQNKALIRDLGIQAAKAPSSSEDSSRRPAKKRKLDLNSQPTRSSARIAAAPAQPSYIDEEPPKRDVISTQNSFIPPSKQPVPARAQSDGPIAADLETLRSGWSSWNPTASQPSREDITGILHFESHPNFLPNKTPAEMLREGAFGGSYFRPLYSAKLRITIEGDWRELPDDWLEGLNVERFLTNPEYNPDVNKYKVSCGQSIEQWEQNGWIDHRYDVRGWFQWYCRFYMGRRCEDDERQVARWAKCVGEKGRWRRTLLKKYKQLGIKEVVSIPFCNTIV